VGTDSLRTHCSEQRAEYRMQEPTDATHHDDRQIPKNVRIRMVHRAPQDRFSHNTPPTDESEARSSPKTNSVRSPSGARSRVTVRATPVGLVIEGCCARCCGRRYSANVRLAPHGLAFLLSWSGVCALRSKSPIRQRRGLFRIASDPVGLKLETLHLQVADCQLSGSRKLV
jgi:hypothetical protein